MPGLLDSLNIARTGMAANRKSMEVTGNNIANVNTPGYSEQSAEAKSIPGVQSGRLTFGQGVNIEEISRAEDIFIQEQLQGAEEKSGKAKAKSTPLAELEQVFGVEGDNLATKMEQFFASWKDLAQNPGGEVERAQVIQRGKNLVSAFEEVGRNLDTVRSNINESLRSEVKTVNSKLRQVADLNTKIANARATGGNAHSAQDERELLLRDLSGKLGVSTYKGKNDMVSVALPGGQVLVQGEEANQLQEDSGNILLDTGNTTWELERSDLGGAFQGNLNIRDVFVPRVREQVDTLQHDLVTEVNAQHQKGYGLDGETGREFFSRDRFLVNDTSLSGPEAIVDNDIHATPPPNIQLEAGGDTQTIEFTSSEDQNGDGQLDLQEMRDTINQKQDLGVQASVWRDDSGGYRLSLASQDRDVDVAVTGSSLTDLSFSNGEVRESGGYQMQVALQDTAHVAAGFSSASGDNRNTHEMAALAEQETVNGKFSFVDYYGKIAGDVGIEVNQNQMERESSQDSLTQLKNRREAKEGVSLKESMLDLTRYQKGFQAAAQYMSKVDEMLQTLMGVAR